MLVAELSKQLRERDASTISSPSLTLLGRQAGLHQRTFSRSVRHSRRWSSLRQTSGCELARVAASPFDRRLCPLNYVLSRVGDLLRVDSYK